MADSNKFVESSSFQLCLEARQDWLDRISIAGSCYIDDISCIAADLSAYTKAHKSLGGAKYSLAKEDALSKVETQDCIPA
jgi:hypothetical protein